MIISAWNDIVDVLKTSISYWTISGCFGNAGSALLVAEIVLSEEKINPPRAVLQSLSMTEGKQRSASEYKQLLEKYGFTSVQIKITGNFLDTILGFRKLSAH